MPNKLPKFLDNHKICIICEGNEEYEYLNRLKNLKVWNEQYDISLVNAGGNGNIPARYQDRYQNGADELVLVFCDTEKKPHEQYEDIKRKINEFHGVDSAANEVIMFGNPCTVAMIRGNNNSTFLLLAISEYDKDNIAHTSVDDLEMCIKSLLNFYDQHGQGHRLVIPLMGTNLSRAGLSHNDSLRVITSLFQLYGDKIHGEVDVVIYKGDKDKVTLDI